MDREEALGLLSAKLDDGGLRAIMPLCGDLIVRPAVFLPRKPEKAAIPFSSRRSTYRPSHPSAEGLP